MSISIASFYVTGGTLQRDAACYVERRADAELYDGLARGRFCYVLTSRQMGKSSLMVRTASRLREEGASVAVLDLTAIGQNLNPEQWYNGLLSQVGQRLDLEDELEGFAYEHKQVGPLQRWMRAIREVVLERCKGRVVIFIDEIDAVRSLPFSTDEFFAAIREFYNSRSEAPELERLTFCLLGVATPSDLIRDTRTTPFNIGQRIELNDFTESEAASLTRGLLREESAAKPLLNRVMYWTGGHPYLTQRLCRAIAEDASVNKANDVDRLCNELFFTHRAQERDDNLLFVRERILRSEVDIAGLLELYRRMHRGKRVRDDETSSLATILRLSGIAKIENGYLRTRNRIYHRVFSEEWVKANMPDAELRRQRAAFRRGVLRAAIVSTLILALITGLAVNLAKQRNRAEQQEIINRRQLYASQITLAYQAWEKGNAGQAVKLLDNHIPKPEQEDLRGFEWRYLWRLCHSDRLTLHHTDPVIAVAFSLDGKILTTGSTDATAKLWDVTTGKELASLKGHTDSVLGIAFSPDGKMLASAGDDAVVKLWDVSARRNIADFKGHKAMVNEVAFSPDGKMLVTASSDRTAKLWDVESKRELRTLNGHADSVYSAAFSPDGKKVATGSWDKSVKIWDVNTGRELAALKGHTVEIKQVLFSSDGKLLISVSLVQGNREGEIKLWDFAALKEIAAFAESNNTLATGIRTEIHVTLSPDDKRLIIASGNNLKLWDIAVGQELVALEERGKHIHAVAISPDGKTIATGNYEKSIKLWRSTTDDETLSSKPATANSNTSTPAGPLNLDFEQGAPGQVPLGWSSNPLHKEDGFTAKLTEEDPKRGRQCALLTRDIELSSILKRDKRFFTFASLMQRFDARPYCGKRVRLRAAVRVELGTQAFLWLRADRSNNETGFFDNMGNRPITSNEWRYYEIVGDIDEDAEWLNLGVLFTNNDGKVYIDDVSFEILGKAAAAKNTKSAKNK